MRFLSGLVSLLMLSHAGAQTPDEEEQRPAPGLIATYQRAAQQQPTITRVEPVPSMHLKAGETPDIRLPPSGWTCQWRGTIEILRPGKHRFIAISSGPLSVKIAEQIVLATDGGNKEKIGPQTELKFGLHPIVVTFAPGTAGAVLSLSWESESFAREPLPGYVLGHSRGDSPPADEFFLGRLAVEEHSCTVCHRPQIGQSLAVSLSTRPGPHLTAAGTRLNANWIYHWLGDPQSLRAEAVMPRMFANNRGGQIERIAVAAFLASQGKPAAAVKLSAAQTDRLASEGRQLFEQTGCVVCHEKQGDRPARATLRLLSAKTTAEQLSGFIRNPSAIDPAGRMPGFDLSDDQALKLATYLVHKDAEEAKSLTPPAPPTADELRQLLLGDNPTAEALLEFNSQAAELRLVHFGRRLFENKRCAACHELKPAGEDKALAASPALRDFTAIAARPHGGCLAEAKDATTIEAPVFGRSLSREAASAFLRQLPASAASAPAELARLTLARLNCTGCHERNGNGGLSEELVSRLLVGQTEQNAEMVSPPSLTGVIDKLQPRYLKEVLEEHSRSRPWMALKMPRFAKELVTPLPAALAALEGHLPNSSPKRAETGDALLEAGRTLVGAKGFGCTKCHDMLGVASQGTRGPELSFVPRRVNFDWYLRWMTDPQRIQPGTRMPTVFLSGQSPHKEILSGDPAQQRLAVWQYLARSRGLPPPDGLQAPSVTEVAASDRPQVIRTFLPDVTPRSMAIRFPNDVHLVYDAQACRLALAFHGEFLNLSPAWDGRGGMKAGIKGTKFWTAPAGFPWAVTDSTASPPDFSNRGNDTAFGAELPQDGQLHPTRLHFRGYHVHDKGPTFTYELDLDDGQTALFTESIASLKNELARGIQRITSVVTPTGRQVWLNAAMADKPPSWQTRAGQSSVLDNEANHIPADATLTVQQQGQSLVLQGRGGSSGAVWCVAPQGDKWCVMIRTPVAGAAQISLTIWRPNESTPAALEAVSRTLSTEH